MLEFQGEHRQFSPDELSINLMDVVIRPTAETAAELVARMIARELRKNPRMVIGLASSSTMESVYAREWRKCIAKRAWISPRAGHLTWTNMSISL